MVLWAKNRRREIPSESQIALDDAKKNLKRITKETSGAVALSYDLRALRKNNHFAEKLGKAFAVNAS